MTHRNVSAARRTWPGLDREFHDRVCAVVRSEGGAGIQQALHGRYALSEDRRIPLGPPVCIRREYGAHIRQFVEAYHRGIEAIVQASYGDGRVQEVLSVPEELRADLDRDRDPRNGRVHLCRLDMLLGPDGEFRVLETNANCPGGLIYAGHASHAWREHLSRVGFDLPEPLDHEDDNWMAKWFLQVAVSETGEDPSFVVLLRQEGGNRLELSEFAECLRGEGVEAEELDPRELTVTGSGELALGGRPLRHGYLKLGIPEFCEMRPALDGFVEALRERRFFVQNGLRGRWVGDNKLCLAILSDPSFRYLFDPGDGELFDEHVPWSRNAALCSPEELAGIRGNPTDYVLKRSLDTRGRGVVVGRGVESGEEWEGALEVATREGWLAQEFCPTTEIEADFDGDALNRHDLAVGAINGKVAGAFIRSSGELRVNVARSGRLHPVFLAA